VGIFFRLLLSVGYLTLDGLGGVKIPNMEVRYELAKCVYDFYRNKLGLNPISEAKVDKALVNLLAPCKHGKMGQKKWPLINIFRCKWPL
jgi:hypothetical protein